MAKIASFIPEVSMSMGVGEADFVGKAPGLIVAFGALEAGLKVPVFQITDPFTGLGFEFGDRSFNNLSFTQHTATSVRADLPADMILELEVGESNTRGYLKERLILTKKPTGGGAIHTISLPFRSMGLELREVDGVNTLGYEVEDVLGTTWSIVFTLRDLIVEDANADSISAEMVVNPGRLEYRIDKDWLKAAAYPVTIDPTIDTTTEAIPIARANFHGVYFAQSYYWAAFDDGDYLTLYRSSDGSSWTDVGRVAYTAANDSGGAGGHAVYFTATEVLCAFKGSGPWYRKVTLGNPLSYWPAAADDDMSPYNVWIYSASLDTGGDPWFGRFENNLAYFVTTDGEGDEPSSTWDQEGFTGDPSNQGGGAPMLPLTGVTNGDMFCFHLNCYSSGHTNAIRGALWDESADSFGSVMDCSGVGNGTSAPGGSSPAPQRCLDAAKVGTDLHVIYHRSDSYIGHWKGVSPYGAANWSEVDGDVTGANNAARATLCSDGTDMWIFYDKADDKIYYRKFSGGSWGDETEWEDRSASTLVGAMTCSREPVNDEIMVMWAEGSGSPYDVNCKILDVGGGPPAPAFGDLMRHLGTWNSAGYKELRIGPVTTA